MPARFLSDADLARLTGWPDAVTGDELAVFFTLPGEDVRWLVQEHRGAGNRLGLAVQRCALPWLGWVPDDLTGCPAAAVARLGDALGITSSEVAGLLVGYGGWQGDTRRTHLREVCQRLGWTVCGPAESKQLDALLAARALEHDTPTVLFAQAVEWLRSERVVRPAVDSLVPPSAPPERPPRPRPLSGSPRSCTTPGWPPNSRSSSPWTPTSASRR